MRLTAKTRYGLSALTQIAREQEATAVTGRSLSAVQKISEPYVEQVMLPLVASGIVKTIRGPKGGYFLNKTLEEISILDVVEAYEGKIDLANSEDYLSHFAQMSRIG